RDNFFLYSTSSRRAIACWAKTAKKTELTKSRLNSNVYNSPMPDFDPASPRVFLVGAGPGNPGLLTLRAAEVLARADLVLHDQLVPPRLLDLANPAAQRVCVRDLPGHHPDRYPHIHELMIESARAGKTVVRLKGGDPLV